MRMELGVLEEKVEESLRMAVLELQDDVGLQSLDCLKGFSH